MSQDILLNSYCNHTILKERVEFSDASRRILLLSTPVAEDSSVKLYANGVWIPQNGLEIPASLVLNTQIPFNVDTDFELKLLTHESTESFKFKKGYYSQNSLINIFKTSKSLAATFENDYIVLKDISGYSGFSSFIKLISGGDFFNIPSGTVKSGVELYPSWSLDRIVKDGDCIKFKKHISSNVTFTVDYKAYMQSCYRCMGSGIENDYNFNSFGDVQLITDENLLYQACMKIILTDVGTNPFHPWYGSDLQNKVGSKMVFSIAGDIRRSIMNAITHFQDLQKNQAQFQNVSMLEKLYKVVDIQVTLDDEVAQRYNVDIVVSNGSNQPISLNIRYSSAAVAPSFSGVNPYLGN